jgi:hypothetical protein
MNIAYLISGIIGAVGFVICMSIAVLHLSKRDYLDGIFCSILASTDLVLAFIWFARCFA